MKTPPSKEKLARSMRVRCLRRLTDLSRREFTKKFGIPAGTLQNWEDTYGNGLSEKGARRLVQFINNAGISCSVEWLLYGFGETPTINAVIPSDVNLTGYYQNGSIIKELEFFCIQSKDSISFQVKDDAMHPFYRSTEYVAGIRHYDQAINSCAGEDCIVLMESGEQLLRRLRKSSIPGLYDLIPLNVNTLIKRAYHENVKLVYAAPVILIRS